MDDLGTSTIRALSNSIAWRHWLGAFNFYSFFCPRALQNECNVTFLAHMVTGSTCLRFLYVIEASHTYLSLVVKCEPNGADAVGSNPAAWGTKKVLEAPK